MIFRTIPMSDILTLIQDRRSIRASFDQDHQVAKEDLGKILEAARWAPTPHNMQNFEILVIDDRKVIKELGKIESRITETFLRENFEQLSFSKEELRQRKVGILGTSFPPSWRDPKNFKKIAADSHPMRLGQAIDRSPVLIIVVYDSRKRAPDSEGDFLGIIGLGCVMENMWLMATSLGINVRVLSDFGDKGVETEVKRILGIAEDLKVAYGLRLGYPLGKQTKGMRVRREVGDFTFYNMYGNGGID
jgi:nitroreductase